MRRVVVLPQPDGPSIEKNSPRRMSNETPATAMTWPNRFVTSSRRTSTSVEVESRSMPGAELAGGCGGLWAAQAGGVGEGRGAIGTLPRQVEVSSAEVAVGRCLL